MIVIYGSEYKKKSDSRIDILKRFGILNQTKSTGNYMLSPLGKLVKTAITNRILASFSEKSIPEIEMPSVLRASQDDEKIRGCVTLVSDDSIPFVCDALYDAKEAMTFLEKYETVAWKKRYVDTSRRMIPTNLRFHSYELVCLLSCQPPKNICDLILQIFDECLGLDNDCFCVRQNSDDDYSIRYCGEESFTIAHIHKEPLHAATMCGIPVEKLLLLLIIHNRSNAKRKIFLFDKVLITYNSEDVLSLNCQPYDFIDAREIKITPKIDLLLGIGVKSIFMLTNSGSIKQVDC